MTKRIYDSEGYEDDKGGSYRKFKDGPQTGLRIAAIVGVAGFLAFPHLVIVWVLVVLILGCLLTRR